MPYFSISPNILISQRPIFEDSHDQPAAKKSKRSTTTTWVRPRLKVRIIDKKSRYYKEKVIVNDVISHDKIECVTSSGKILDNVDPGNVETVIPKYDYALVMIVRLEHKGKIAELVRKDTKRESVTVRTVQTEKEIVLDLGYDDVCELTGVEEDY